MWLKRFLAISSLLFVALFCAVSQSTESPKTIIIDKLTSFQLILQDSKQQTANALQLLSLSQQTVDQLTQELTSSKLLYENEISGLRLDLQKSEASLVELRQLSKDQTAELMTLSKDLDKLKSSLKLYRSVTVIAVVIATTALIYAHNR